MRRAAGAVLLLLLTGCSAVTAPDPGLDPDELTDFRSYLLDSYWESTGLSDDLRPPPPAATTVTPEEWIFAYVKCMNNEGFDNYTLVDGGYSFNNGSAARSDDEVIADYLCNTRYEIDGQFDSLYNEAQLDYLFTYYQQILVPCVQLLGYDVVDAPTRAQFADNWGGWHPYFSVRASQQDAFYLDQRVPTECPAVPAGMADPGFAVYWSQQP